MALSNQQISLAIDGRKEVARLDMATGLVSIARPLKTGAQRMAFIKKQRWKGGEVTMRGIAQDDHDLAVLLAFIVLAEQQNNNFCAGKDVESLLPETKYTNAADELIVITVNTSYVEVCRVLGIKVCGSANSAIWQSLCNLATIVVDATSNGEEALTHLIIFGNGIGNKSLSVTLSYRLTRALLGDGSYGAIEMNVFRNIPRGAARILYVWLISWCGGHYGTRVPIGLNRLVEHVWGESVEKLSQNTRKDRRRVIRNSLREIERASNEIMTCKFVDDNVVIQRLRSEVAPTIK